MPTDLADVLEQFKGKTPDDIAAMVKRRGIKGRAGTTYKCPMALLLNGAFTGDYVIGRKYIVRRSGHAIQQVATPKNVAQFVRKFDTGGYPELVAPPPRCLKTASERGARGRKPHSGPSKPKKIVNHIAKLVNRFGDQ